jgi:hypothetical protein
MDILEAERDWLTKRAPLQDALLSVAQGRRETMKQDLETIKQTLETTFQREQSRLSGTASTLENQLGQTTDPLEAFRLTVRLETVDLLKITADYRHRLNVLGDDIVVQEQRNAQVKQDVDRMTSLVENTSAAKALHNGSWSPLSACATSGYGIAMSRPKPWRPSCKP